MSYGNQLHVFDGQARRHAANWRCIVLCKSAGQARGAMEDARDFLKGQLRNIGAYLLMPSGARIEFRIVTNENEALSALYGREFTQIVWLHRSDNRKVREMARAQLRSKTVPMHDLRYEYALEDV